MVQVGSRAVRIVLCWHRFFNRKFITVENGDVVWVWVDILVHEGSNLFDIVERSIFSILSLEVLV